MPSYLQSLEGLLNQKEKQIQLLKNRLSNYNSKLKEEEKIRKAISKFENNANDVYDIGAVGMRNEHNLLEDIDDDGQLI